MLTWYQPFWFMLAIQSQGDLSTVRSGVTTWMDILGEKEAGSVVAVDLKLVP